MAKTKKGKQSLIINLRPDDYEIFDQRIKKPLTIEVFGKVDEDGSMVLQETDELSIKGKPLDYFTPNSVAVLLSISNKAIERSKRLFDDNLNPDNSEIELSKATDKIDFLKTKSKEVCDYIEEIQTSIVFAYTSLEAFADQVHPFQLQILFFSQNILNY